MTDPSSESSNSKRQKMQGEEQHICIKWSGKEFSVPFTQNTTIVDLKSKLQELTQVLPERQKLLVKTKEGKQADDAALVSNLNVKPGAKVMMMGTPEVAIRATEEAAQAAPEVQDDFDIGAEDAQTLDVKDQPEVQEKLARRIKSVDVKILNPPRPGKKCLVLNSTAERPEELARPYLHEFLVATYQFYDIIIWSATSMKWIEVKMQELGMATHPDYKLMCYLDCTSMVTVNTEKYGVFNCKPLAFIWEKFPGFYNEHNTVMLDDLRYLTMVGPLEKLSSLEHNRWPEYLSGNRQLPSS
ncbi:hypothetical protein DUNSADRAFT_7746 [Dunaliella salina]|uniref:Ubiquitin-like domain-containing protein n=1 Tax=Dunaliella salina TaxID=3046 RepID=A0ABQ7GKR8_DUNSA|nr:hypothetical protein DUNSADRAFT_7746 [Dunaliella salina]|eukprot:KAF5835203.1 hypothetical protein DUNSADRAFT_7746 [Dunaliella salina]